MAVPTPVLYWAQFIALGAAFIVLFFVVAPLSLVLCFMSLNALRSQARDISIFEKLEAFCHRHGWKAPLALCSALAKLFCSSSSKREQLAYIQQRQNLQTGMQTILQREDFMIADIEVLHAKSKEAHLTAAEAETLQQLEQEREEIPLQLRINRQRFEELTQDPPQGPWIREDARNLYTVLGQSGYQRLADPGSQC